MATGTINFYNSFKRDLLNSVIDLDAGGVTIALLNEGYSANPMHSAIAQIAEEVAVGGYARKVLGSLSIAATASAFVFDAADVVWTASGAAFTAYHYVLFDDAATDDPLIAWGLIDNSPAKVTVADGNTLTISWNANGILKLD